MNRGKNLDKPGSEVLVDEEVKAEEFKLVFSVEFVKFLFVGEDCIDNQIPHPRDKMLLNIQLKLRKLLIKIFLKIMKAQGIPILVLPILIPMLL